MATKEEKTEEAKDAFLWEAGTRDVLVKPRISEKAGALGARGKYVFVVHRSANKVEIKKAIERTYKVKVTQVNVLNTSGKRRSYGRTAGRTSPFKKAIVTLKEGDKIAGLTDVV